MPKQVVQKRHWLENGMCGGSNKQETLLYSRLIDDGEGRFRGAFANARLVTSPTLRRCRWKNSQPLLRADD